MRKAALLAIATLAALAFTATTANGQSFNVLDVGTGGEECSALPGGYCMVEDVTGDYRVYNGSSLVSYCDFQGDLKIDSYGNISLSNPDLHAQGCGETALSCAGSPGWPGLVEFIGPWNDGQATWGAFSADLTACVQVWGGSTVALEFEDMELAEDSNGRLTVNGETEWNGRDITLDLEADDGSDVVFVEV